MSAPEPPGGRWTCAHGHDWEAYQPCQECLATREQPHEAEPVDAQLEPGRTTKYRICQRCTQAVVEPIHRPAQPSEPTP